MFVTAGACPSIQFADATAVSISGLLEQINSLRYAAKGNKIPGLFQLDNMAVHLDHEILKNPKILGNFTDQPTLMEMTGKALGILSRNPNGFFLNGFIFANRAFKPPGAQFAKIQE